MPKEKLVEGLKLEDIGNYIIITKDNDLSLTLACIIKTTKEIIIYGPGFGMDGDSDNVLRLAGNLGDLGKILQFTNKNYSGFLRYLVIEGSKYYI